MCLESTVSVTVIGAANEIGISGSIPVCASLCINAIGKKSMNPSVPPLHLGVNSSVDWVL